MPKINRTKEEWRMLLAEQHASGQTQEAWCLANGVNLYTLRKQSSRLKRMEKETKPEARRKAGSTGWIEVKTETLPNHTSGISIAHGGFTVTVTAGFSDELLTGVLRAVSRACC